MTGPEEEFTRKLTALRKLCGVFSRYQTTDEVLVAMTEAFEDIPAEKVEGAVVWSIKNESTLPTPSQLREGIENGQYRTRKSRMVVRTVEERIKSSWELDFGESGCKDIKSYKAFIDQWESENPGLDYYFDLVEWPDCKGPDGDRTLANKVKEAFFADSETQEPSQC